MFWRRPRKPPLRIRLASQSRYSVSDFVGRHRPVVAALCVDRNRMRSHRTVAKVAVPRASAEAVRELRRYFRRNGYVRRQNRLPIYGREAVLRFLRLIKSGGSADPRSSPQGRPRGPQARVAGWCVSAEAGKGFPVPGREHPASGKWRLGKKNTRRPQGVVGQRIKIIGFEWHGGCQGREHRRVRIVGQGDAVGSVRNRLIAARRGEGV